MEYPDWVVKYKRKGTAIHKIRGHYYLYEVGSNWDKGVSEERGYRNGYEGNTIKTEGGKIKIEVLQVRCQYAP